MSDPIPEIDLRGVPCPLNWAKAKVRLEPMPRGRRLAFRVDDPRSARDMPRAAEAEGYVVVEIAPDGAAWRIVIER
ncbi:MAG: sulfurtransferase TusA family protein [Deltaproteobacteria bacterium]|nr:sulfurtransferase TusA family protein [Deltaproteobacteria bacterium]